MWALEENIQIMMLLKHIKVSEQNHLWLLLALQFFGASKSMQLKTISHVK